MRKYKVYVQWIAYGFHTVAAKSQAKAMEIAQDLPLPDPKYETSNDEYTVTGTKIIPIKGQKSKKIP